MKKTSVPTVKYLDFFTHYFYVHIHRLCLEFQKQYYQFIMQLFQTESIA